MQNKPIGNKLFDPRTSFIALPILRWIVFGFIFVAVIISILIIVNSHCSLDLSYSGFNQAATMFRVPIGVLATLIPVIALLAASHRSEQTKEQIRITSEQNVFSNYYKHLEEFLKHCNYWDTKDPRTPSIRSPRRLYGIIYPSSRNGDYDIDKMFISHIENYANNLHSIVINTEKTSESWRKTLPTLISSAINFFNPLGLSQSSLWGVHADIKNRSTGFVPTIDVQEVIRNTVYLFKALHYVLEFDVNYESSPAMQAIFNMDIDDVPHILLDF